MRTWEDGTTTSAPARTSGNTSPRLARFARATDSEATRAKVKRLVRGLAETMDPSGKFFVDLRYPGYTYDKLVCGLLDAHSYAGDATALDVLAETTRAACRTWRTAPDFRRDAAASAQRRDLHLG